MYVLDHACVIVCTFVHTSVCACENVCPYVHVCNLYMGVCGVCVCVSFLWPGEKVMQDDEFTCDLFRFLQLLCEGHNSGVHKFSTVNFTGKWLNILICENLPVLSQKHFHCLWLDR